jgi:hypothetical protein
LQVYFKVKFSKHKLLAELGLKPAVVLLCDEFHVGEFMKIVFWVLGMKYIFSLEVQGVLRNWVYRVREWVQICLDIILDGFEC